jgi:hypothetical protein
MKGVLQIHEYIHFSYLFFVVFHTTLLKVFRMFCCRKLNALRIISNFNILHEELFSRKSLNFNLSMHAEPTAGKTSILDRKKSNLFPDTTFNADSTSHRTGILTSFGR